MVIMVTLAVVEHLPVSRSLSGSYCSELLLRITAQSYCPELLLRATAQNHYSELLVRVIVPPTPRYHADITSRDRSSFCFVAQVTGLISVMICTLNTEIGIPIFGPMPPK